jgi:cis-L-3-hydroxyproline dehydratase
MKLTDYEQKMLDGAEGEIKQKAMELIVWYGNVLEAEQLCQVSWADLFCGLPGYLNEVKSDQFDDMFS